MVENGWKRPKTSGKLGSFQDAGRSHFLMLLRLVHPYCTLILGETDQVRSSIGFNSIQEWWIWIVGTCWNPSTGKESKVRFCCPNFGSCFASKLAQSSALEKRSSQSSAWQKAGFPFGFSPTLLPLLSFTILGEWFVTVQKQGCCLLESLLSIAARRNVSSRAPPILQEIVQTIKKETIIHKQLRSLPKTSL